MKISYLPKDRFYQTLPSVHKAILIEFPKVSKFFNYLIVERVTEKLESMLLISSGSGLEPLEDKIIYSVFNSKVMLVNDGRLEFINAKS